MRRWKKADAIAASSAKKKWQNGTTKPEAKARNLSVHEREKDAGIHCRAVKRQ